MTVRASIFALLFSAGTCAAFAQQPEPPAARRITLREAVDLALAHNHAVRLAQLSVDEKDRAKDVAKSAYFPQVRNETTLVHLTDTQLVEIPAGGLGVVGATPVPPQTLILNQGGVSAVTNGTGVVQPLTQLFRVKAANDVARAEAEATRGKARGLEDETALRVHQIYYRILIADVRRRAVLAKIQASEDVQRERVAAGAIRQRARSRSDREPRPRAAGQAGAADDRAAAFRSADAAQRRHRLAPDDAAAARSERVADQRALRALRARSLRSRGARLASGDRGSARAGRKGRRRRSVSRSTSSSRTWRRSRATASRTTCRSLPDRFGTVGIRASVDLFDGGRKRAVVRERETQLAQAKENLARISDEVELRVQTAYNKMERTRQMVAVSEELLALRGESRRVAADAARSTAARSARRRRSRRRRSSRRRRRSCNRSSITCKPPTRWMRPSGDDLGRSRSEMTHRPIDSDYASICR